MKTIEEKNNLLIYKNEDGNIVVDAIYKDETLWLSQKAMSKVFDCSADNISLHLKNIFKDKELNETSVTEESSITASDGKKYKTKIYNLDAIIAVGYRINSKKATEFRIWATKILKEYMTNHNYPLLVELANKYNKTQNQILLNYYVYEKKLIPITKANKIEHIDLNLEALDFKMEQEDYNRLNEFSCKEFDQLDVDWQDNGGVPIYKFANQIE